MKFAVISDIHANLEAIKEVLADIDGFNIQKIVCLGDNIGYGPEPERVAKLLLDRNIPCVMGNHELALVKRSYLDRMNINARKSNKLSQKLLSGKTTNYLSSLKPSMIFNGFPCVHGCPPDDITTYLFEVSNSRLQIVFKEMKEKICFAGHTHELQLFSFDGTQVIKNPLKEGLKNLVKNHKHIINVGSVGQPRDGNNKAKYVIFDDSNNTINVRHVDYDIAKTANKIIELGFPEVHAKCLW